MNARMALALVVALMAGGAPALAWQMETVEPGRGQNIIGADPSGPGIGGAGSGAGPNSGPFMRVEPHQPGTGSSIFGDDRRRPTTFGEGREPFFRPGSGRNCSGEGPGRVCF